MTTTYDTRSTLGVLARQEMRNYLRHRLFWFGSAMTTPSGFSSSPTSSSRSGGCGWSSTSSASG